MPNNPLNEFNQLVKFVKTGHPFTGMPQHFAAQISSMGFHGYVNDFHSWEGAVGDSAAPGTGGWIVTSVDGGGDAGEVIDVKDSTTYGALRILSNDADNDSTQIQLNGSAFKYVAGKRLWFFTRWAVQDADDSEVGFGLVIETATDMIGTAPTDGLYFEKAETATAMDFHVRKDDAETESTLLGGTLSDDTYRIQGFVVNTDGSITVYDGTDIEAMTVVATIAATNANLPTDEDLTIAYHVQTGAAATRYLDIDWVLCVQER